MQFTNIRQLSFNKYIKSGIVTFEICILGAPHVRVTVGIAVAMASQPQPHELKLELIAGDSTAEGKAYKYSILLSFTGTLF